MDSIKVTTEWNHEYMKNHPNSWLHMCLPMLFSKAPSIFIETCCHITVAAILWKLGFDYDSFKNHGCIDFSQAEQLSSTFVILINEDDHVLLVHEGWIYQSFWKNYSCKSTEITDEIRQSFVQPTWKNITGVDCKIENLNLEYFIPQK